MEQPRDTPDDNETKKSIKDNHLLLAGGKRILLGTNAWVPVVRQRIGEVTVDVLRGTG